MFKQGSYILKGLLVMMMAGIFAIQSTKAQTYGVSTSATQWATLTMNAEVNFPVSNKVSVHLPVSYNPWVLGDNTRLQQLSFKPGVRFWTGQCYSRFFISIYAMAARFHVGGLCGHKYRYDGNVFGIGAGAGYAYPISKRLNIEAEIGFGGGYADYDKCRWEKNSRLIAQYSGFKFIPTKLDVSIVYFY